MSDFKEEHKIYKTLSPTGRSKLKRQLKAFNRPTVQLGAALQFAAVTMISSVALSTIDFPTWLAAVVGYLAGFYWLSIRVHLVHVSR